MKDRTVITPRYTVHAAMRTVERLNIDIGDIFKGFCLTKYKHRYVDRRGAYHIYDDKRCAEIVGRFNIGFFDILTVIKMDIGVFYERKRNIGLSGDSWEVHTEKTSIN